MRVEFLNGEIRRFEKGDEADFFALVRQEEVAKNAGLPEIKTLEEALSAVRVREKQDSELALVYRGRLVGQIGVYAIEPDRPNVREIGYALNRDYWGQGVMTAALTALFQKLKEAGVDTLTAETLEDNARSQALLRRVGFVQDGAYVRPPLPGVSPYATRMLIFSRSL